MLVEIRLVFLHLAAALSRLVYRVQEYRDVVSQLQYTVEQLESDLRLQHKQTEWLARHKDDAEAQAAALEQQVNQATVPRCPDICAP